MVKIDNWFLISARVQGQYQIKHFLIIIQIMSDSPWAVIKNNHINFLLIYKII